VPERALGSEIWDVNGNRYLDFTAGIGVLGTGHCHPEVIQAAMRQMSKGVHFAQHIMYNQETVRYAEMLKQVVPPGLTKFFFNCSGSEAIEAAVKLARAATKRNNIIVFSGGHHGRTIGALSLTRSKSMMSESCGPGIPGVFTAPYPYCLRCPASNDSSCCQNPLHQIKMMLKQQTAPSDTAAILIEPVLGEGGYIPAGKQFLQGLRALCDEHGIKLIIDEVQSGFGRTGRYFACQHYDVLPDIMVMAKAIASGYPLSGIAYRAELEDGHAFGSMGGTYGGNVLAIAAAEATLKVMEQEKLVENAMVRGEQLSKGLRRINSELNCIKDVRGLGLMVGCELDETVVGSGAAAKISQKCLQNGMLLLTAGVYETLRFIPPLVVTEAEINEGLAIFREAIIEHMSEVN
jgi:4-aminobutyrate aminotransferase